MDIAQKLQAALMGLLDLLGEFSHSRTAVAWTGGKDSTLVLFLWRQALSKHLGLDDAALRAQKIVRALNLDTGLKFQEILSFRDSLAADLNLDLHIIKPDPPADLITPAQDKMVCCGARKVEPLRRALQAHNISLLLTGIRADESPSRQDRLGREVHADPPHVRVHPILDFTEMDVWAAHQLLAIPYCSLYDEGYRSLGCRPCTLLPEAGGAERSGRAGDKEHLLEQLHALGYF